MTENVKHSSKNDAWQTPDFLVRAARETLGGIDLDPASTPEANETIGATRIFTREDDALRRLWNIHSPLSERVFCNPPGGSRTVADLVATNSLPFPARRGAGQKESLPALFWWKLMQLRHFEFLRGAVWICFSLEPLQITQRLPDIYGHSCPAIGDFAVCFFKERVAYIDPDTGKEGGSPAHASAAVYVPGTEFRLRNFVDAFEPYGRIMIGDTVLDMLYAQTDYDAGEDL